MRLNSKITPTARQVAAALNIDPARLRGSGLDGRVRKIDVLAAANGHTATTRPAPAVQQLAIALHWPLPQALTAVEVDMSAVAAYRARYAADFARRRLELSDLACLLAVLVRVLPAHPLLNAAWNEAGILRRRRLHVQVFDGERSGVICDAGDYTVRGMARQLRDLAPSDEATLSIRVLYGARLAPEPLQVGRSAGLSLGSVTSQAVCHAETLAIRRRAIIALNYDIRVLDQRQADQFLMSLQKQLASFAG
jgi:pyruvate/2-oxoglutarate dehydrogenase complex dihydrolipoamide acyltransferase (E2) component